MRRKLCALVLFFSLLSQAQNQYWVSTSGSDSNNGTSVATAWRTIAHAIATFSLGAGGAVINTLPGQYNGSINLNRGGSSPGVRLVWKCTQSWLSASGCVLRNAGGGDSFIVINANNIDIGALGGFGFDVSNPALSYAITGACDIPQPNPGDCSTSNSIHILGNNLHNLSTSISTCEVIPNGHPAIAIQNHHGPYVTDLQIVGNKITDIGPPTLSRLNGGPGCNNYYGMYIDAQRATIQLNVMARIAGYGVHYYSSPCQGSISNNDISDTERNSIIVGGHDCNNGTPEGSVTVSNNILGRTGPGFQNLSIGVAGGSGTGSSSHPVLVTNNIFSGGAAGQFLCVAPCFATNTNAKTEAPTTTYVSYPNDFHLKPGSVANQGGTPVCVLAGLIPCTSSRDFSGAGMSSPLPIGAYTSGTSSGIPPVVPIGLKATVQ